MEGRLSPGHPNLLNSCLTPAPPLPGYHSSTHSQILRFLQQPSNISAAPPDGLASEADVNAGLASMLRVCGGWRWGVRSCVGGGGVYVCAYVRASVGSPTVHQRGVEVGARVGCWEGCYAMKDAKPSPPPSA